MGNFTGFTDDTFRFLLELAFNNNKTFFEANRKRYETQVRDRMRALALDLLPMALEIDPQICKRPTGIVSRINRDTRFSRDKSPYRDHLWFIFRRDGESISEGLSFYFEIKPTAYTYGLGMYDTNKPLMDALRERATTFETKFRQIISAPALLERFTLSGEDYKRPPLPDIAPELGVWLNKRYFYLHHDSTELDRVKRADFADELKSGMEVLRDIYAFSRGI
ncbi:hypothetical protein SDC9_164691 [bioreactor metagenome]|uniref:TIGR02453 family protein n=1 Tax=bioreactor metagenome TaxID=1076179 RepID=A0A645FSA3_9ZZZZ